MSMTASRPTGPPPVSGAGLDHPPDVRARVVRGEGIVRTYGNARRLGRGVKHRSERCQSRLSIGLLGPLSVSLGGDDVVISGARRRDVLIRLVLNEGRSLESGRLLESVWEGDAAAGAVNSLQCQVGYLRRQLGEGRVVTEGRAYRLDLDGVSVDSVEFEAEVAAARVALEDGLARESVGLLRSALARWRGPVLLDVIDHSWGQAEIARLTELNGVAHELLLQALLATG